MNGETANGRSQEQPRRRPLKPCLLSLMSMVALLTFQSRDPERHRPRETVVPAGPWSFIPQKLSEIEDPVGMDQSCQTCPSCHIGRGSRNAEVGQSRDRTVYRIKFDEPCSRAHDTDRREERVKRPMRQEAAVMVQCEDEDLSYRLFFLTLFKDQTRSRPSRQPSVRALGASGDLPCPLLDHSDWSNGRDGVLLAHPACKVLELLSMQNGSSFAVPYPPTDLNSHSATLGSDFAHRDSTPPELTLSGPAAFSESPSSGEDCQSHGASAAVDDNSDDLPGPWSWETQEESAVKLDSRIDLQGTIRPSDTAPSSSTTFGFTLISSGDADMLASDITPKVEEIGDSMDVLERSREPVGNLVEPAGGTVGVPVNVPRKRGRPRKHPLPTPGGQSKIAKGRSKTGCITCRRRKKKCDETKPACLNCQKNAVVCEGYPPKEIWKSGKQKLEDAVRRSSLTALPRGLPFLIDGIETDVDRRFLDHFVYEFSRVLTLINDDSNPFKEILLPMATQHRGLMHSLMCLSGSHLSALDPEPRLKERKHYHFDRAIRDLRENINASSSNVEEQQLLIEDPIIASTIALCLNTICEGETNGEYRSHMDAARYLLVTQRPRNEKFRQFIIEFFQYHDISNSLTSLDRRPLGLVDDLRLPDFVPHAQAGALLGIFDGLFNYISEITKLRDRIRQRHNEGYEPAVDYQTLSEAVTIDSALRDWEPSYPPNTPNWYAAQLYRQSTWVYLYRTIRPSRPNEKIAQVVDDGLAYLDLLPVDAGAYSIMLMPLFLLGCSSFEPRQRERVKKGFEALRAYSNLRNIEPALKVVQQVWEVMENNMEESWDWEKIISDMHMDFLIT